MAESTAGTTSTESEAPIVEVRRTIRASQQRVFEAWTQTEKLKAWHAPGPLTVSFAEIDLRKGGKYCIHMTEPDGKEHRVSGEYREIDAPRKIVYTWGWDGDHPVKDSVVTIEFNDLGNATEVVLRHAGITYVPEREGHAKGWTSILDKLETTYADNVS